jgi:hypothetical protein
MSIHVFRGLFTKTSSGIACAARYCWLHLRSLNKDHLAAPGASTSMRKTPYGKARSIRTCSNEISALASAQGYSVTNKLWQLFNGWLMEAKRANGYPPC